MYYNGAELTGGNVVRVMYAARKYLLDGLVEHCELFLNTKITTDNVCTILDDCIRYNENELVDTCHHFVDRNVKNVVNSDHFQRISEAGLRVLLSSDLLGEVEEVDLFKACIKWAQMQQTGDDKGRRSVRDILGPLLYEVRFVGRMSVKEICDIRHDILTSDEQLALMRHAFEPNQTRLAIIQSMGFNIRQRNGKGMLNMT